MARRGTERARRNREDIRVVFAGTTAVTTATGWPQRNRGGRAIEQAGVHRRAGDGQGLADWLRASGITA